MWPASILVIAIRSNGYWGFPRYPTIGGNGLRTFLKASNSAGRMRVNRAILSPDFSQIFDGPAAMKSFCGNGLNMESKPTRRRNDGKCNDPPLAHFCLLSHARVRFKTGRRTIPVINNPESLLETVPSGPNKF